jgi:hypothetical protein
MWTILSGFGASLGAADRKSTALDGTRAGLLPAISSGGCSAGAGSTCAALAMACLKERVWYKHGVSEVIFRHLPAATCAWRLFCQRRGATAGDAVGLPRDRARDEDDR